MHLAHFCQQPARGWGSGALCPTPQQKKNKVFSLFSTQNLLPFLKVSALGHSTKLFQNGFRFNRKPFELCFDPTAALRLFLVRQNKSYSELVFLTRSRSPGAGRCSGPCSPLPGPSPGAEGAPRRDRQPRRPGTPPVASDAAERLRGGRVNRGEAGPSSPRSRHPLRTNDRRAELLPPLSHLVALPRTLPDGEGQVSAWQYSL